MDRKKNPQVQHVEPQQELIKSKGAPGLTHTWRLWRHCCCRYGWYPLIIAPIVTTGCLLSLYSSAGCDFIRFDVGFTPSNQAWNQSTGELGMFFYQSGEPEVNIYRETFVEGCRWYEDDFTENFIDDDRTWKVSRIMAYISGVSSILAMTTSWLFVISPLPSFFFWPGVLLPSLMTAFLAEGSKFLFFDTSICRNTVWFPSGADSLPRVAEECTLGSTGYYAVAAGTIFFLSLILVCLKAPDKRELEPHYGDDYDHGGNDLESAHDFDPSGESYGDGGSREMYDANDSEDRDYAYAPRAAQDELPEKRFSPEDSVELDFDANMSEQTSVDFRDDDDNLISERLKNLDPSEDKYTAKPKDDLEDGTPDDRYQPTKPSIEKPEPIVSESRLHTVEKMELNTTGDSQDLIEKFVSDLNVSFQVEVEEEETKKEKQEKEAVETPGFYQTLCGPSTAQSL